MLQEDDGVVEDAPYEEVQNMNPLPANSGHVLEAVEAIEDAALLTPPVATPMHDVSSFLLFHSP